MAGHLVQIYASSVGTTRAAGRHRRAQQDVQQIIEIDQDIGWPEVEGVCSLSGGLVGANAGPVLDEGVHVIRTAARLALAPALLVVTLVGSLLAPASAADVLRPGTLHSDVLFDPPAASACRLGFVYDGTGPRSGHTYFGTAAHCVLAVGDDIYLPGTGQVFGDVAAIGNAATAATDWALIEVRSEFLGQVSAAMEGSPQYPTGVTSPTQTNAGDPIQLAPSLVLGTPRQVTMVDDDAGVYRVSGSEVPSDSGGPLAHVPTGRALGAVSRGVNCTDPGTCEFYEGPTVQGILAKAAAVGFPITLRTT